MGKNIIEKEECDLDADTLMMTVLDCGADDFAEEDDCYEIYTAPDSFDEILNNIKNAGITEFVSAEVTMIPQTYVTLSDENAIKCVNRILDLLDEDDDVQNVYHNYDEQ